MLKVLKATYGGVNIKDLVDNNFIKDNVVAFTANNETFGDPLPHVSKTFEIEIEDEGVLFTYKGNEGENFSYPKQRYKTENTLVLTSCNRIEQVLFAIAVNKEIIKENFNLVVADCSTPFHNLGEGVQMHRSDDPYNLINDLNYNPYWQVIENYVKEIPKIKEFRMIHLEPRLSKQIGEANLTSLGLNVAALLGSKYAIKLTGVCHLKYDIFTKFKDYVGDKTVATWHRSGFFNQKSTRVFACRPDELNISLMTSGWVDWVNEYDFIERKFERIINTTLLPDKINHMEFDERDIIVDEGVARTDHRKVIHDNLSKHNLLSSSDRYIQKFLNGGIW